MLWDVIDSEAVVPVYELVKRVLGFDRGQKACYTARPYGGDFNN
jgi:hypothetical protein